jgi:capsular polysaccharide biosynthesis protein
MTGMKALLAVVRDNLLVLIIWTLAGAAIAGGINLLVPVVYEANAKIFIATPYWNDSTALADPNVGGAQNLAYGDEFTQQRMTSYERLVSTPIVTDTVAEQLRLGESSEELSRKLTGRAVPETVMLQVNAQDSSPARAAAIADMAARRTIDVIKAVERPPNNAVPPVQPVLFEPASVPKRPISPRTLLTVFCGAVIGFLLGLSLIVRSATSREARRLARIRGDDDGDTTPAAEPSGPLGVLTRGAYPPAGGVDVDANLLRIEVEYGLTEAGVQSLAMTSPRATPTTGSVADRLAIALGEAGSPTIVVRADLAAGQGDSTVKLGDLIGMPAILDAAIQADERSGLTWIALGSASDDSSAETGANMRGLLSDLAGRYRYVIVVSSGTLELTDALDMASVCGASILVDPIAFTTPGQLRESERLLRLARGTYLGRVVVADRSFLQDVEIPQSEDRRTALTNQSNAVDGEPWS